jgi:hypothetical protein
MYAAHVAFGIEGHSALIGTSLPDADMLVNTLFGSGSKAN